MHLSTCRQHKAELKGPLAMNDRTTHHYTHLDSIVWLYPLVVQVVTVVDSMLEALVDDDVVVVVDDGSSFLWI